MSTQNIKTTMTPVKDYLKKHFRHFNAAAVAESAQGWVDHLNHGGKMLLAMGGAMSTAELGISLAEMIRRNKVHAISTTGANLEEDIFNLVAHEHYKRVPNYRSLNVNEEVALRDQGLNRVTDTCIPEEEAMRKIERKIVKLWQTAEKEKQRHFPYEFIYQLIRDKSFEDCFETDPKNSWVVAACEKGIPIYTPGWEDSTLGNFIVANRLRGELSSFDFVKNGLEQMEALVAWYRAESKDHQMGFFQIGGGIAGDFAICVVPLMHQDLKIPGTRLWSYFAQISDSTTSYGSYSGAVPNEKITWYKIEENAPRFIVESDATIVAPLIFGYVLES